MKIVRLYCGFLLLLIGQGCASRQDLVPLPSPGPVAIFAAMVKDGEISVEIRNTSSDYASIPAHNGKLLCSVLVKKNREELLFDYADFIHLRSIHALWTPMYQTLKPGQHLRLKLRFQDLRSTQTRERIDMSTIANADVFCRFNVGNNEMNVPVQKWRKP